MQVCVSRARALRQTTAVGRSQSVAIGTRLHQFRNTSVVSDVPSCCAKTPDMVMAERCAGLAEATLDGKKRPLDTQPVLCWL